MIYYRKTLSNSGPKLTAVHCIDEERHRRTAITAPEDKLKNLPLTRERFEE